MRFSIRDLLWLTLLAAFAVAWWIDRSRLAAEVERLRPKLIAIDFAWPVSVIEPATQSSVSVDSPAPVERTKPARREASTAKKDE